MKNLIKKIRNIMKKSEISGYNLSKLTGISEGQLSLIFNNKRQITSSQFYKIIEVLPISVADKEEMTEDFCKLYYSFNDYTSIKHIYAMIKQLSDLTLYDSKLAELMEPSKLTEPFEDKIYRGANVNLVLSALMSNEFAFGDKYIYFYLGNNEQSYLLSNIDLIVRSYKHKNKIIVISDFSNEAQESYSNVATLKNLLPIALSDHTQSYEFYYENVPAQLNNSYLTPYPYFIVFSNCIVFINSVGDEIMLHSHPDVVKSMQNRCEGRMLNCKKMMELSSTVYSMIEEVVSNNGETQHFYGLEYEPCFAMQLSPEIAMGIVPTNIEGLDEMKKILSLRLSQLKNIKKSIQIFDKNSLMEFAATGRIQEFPPEYARNLTVEERVYLLNELLKCAKTDEHIIRALNPSNLVLSECVSMFQSNGFVQFSMWGSTKTAHKYCNIKEESIYSAFKTFMKFLPVSSYVYTKDRTIAFIEEALEYATEQVGKSRD